MVLIDNFVEYRIHVQSAENSEIYVPLEEYEDPDADSEVPIPNGIDAPVVRYIEAQTGRKFRIYCTYKAGLKLYGATSVVTKYDIDNGTLKGHYIPPIEVHQDEVQRNSTSYAATQKVYMDGVLYNITFAFGAARTDDEILDPTQAKKAPDAGTISINSRRITFASHRQAPKPIQTLKPNDLLTKKSIAKGVSHTLAVGSRERVNHLLDSKVGTYDYLKGPHGSDKKVEYRYRSRRALQYLGCIPFSPEPETQLVIDNDDTSPDAVQRLREQLDRQAHEIARLKAESRKSVAPNPALQNAGSSMTDPIDLDDIPSSGMKREAPIIKEENESFNGTSSRQGKRAKTIQYSMLTYMD